MKTIYITDDGKRFTSLKEAKAHEDRMINGNCYEVAFNITGQYVVSEVYAYDVEDAVTLAKKELPYEDYFDLNVTGAEVHEW